MKTVTPTLSEPQVEIIGYALRIAIRKRRADRHGYKPGGAAYATASEQISRMNEARRLLDATPRVEGGEG